MESFDDHHRRRKELNKKKRNHLEFDVNHCEEDEFDVVMIHVVPKDIEMNSERERERERDLQ